MELPINRPQAAPISWDVRIPRILLGITMLCTGAAGLVGEYLLSTVSTFILGNSIEQFSIIIATMLLMMGIAGWVQRFFTDDKLVEKFIGAEILLALLVGFAPIALYAAYAVMESHFQLVQYSLIMAIGFLIGIEIPLAMRINERYSKSLGGNIANVWATDYVGSFIGAIIWAFFLIRTFPLTEIGFLVAGLNFVVATVTFSYFAWKRCVVHVKPLSIAIVLTMVALAFGFSQNRRWSQQLEQKLYDDPIVMAETTKYQRIVMTKASDPQEYRLYLNGNLQFSSVDEHIYHESLVIPVLTLAPRRERILILGGGDGLALREVLKHRDVREVTLVDLDPDMVKLCSTHPVMRQLNGDSFADARVHHAISEGVRDTSIQQRVRQEIDDEVVNDRGFTRPKTETIAYVTVYTLDADQFVTKQPRQWDVVIIDLPDPNSVELAKLYSREFYKKVRNVLAEDGILVVQSTSPFQAKETFWCVERTMRSAGLHTKPYHANVPTFGDWGWVMAWKPTMPPAVMEERIQSLTNFPVETRWITPEVFRSELVFGKDARAVEFNEVSTLMRPVVLDYYIHDGWKIE